MAFQGTERPQDGKPPLEQKSQFSEKSFPVQIRQLLPAQKQPLERTHWPELQDVGEPGFQLLSRFPKGILPQGFPYGPGLPFRAFQA